MSVPQVVIVGRPNVGKSSLLNWLAGRRISIVDDQAGATRDRITHFMEHNARFFELVDTGGIGIQDSDNLSKQVEEQVETALETADLVLFLSIPALESPRSMSRSPAGCGTSKSR